MPKVDLNVIGTRTEPVVFEYTWKDVALYNIGVGASEKDLAFVYENVPGGLKVLPSFCVVPAMRAFPRLGDRYGMVTDASRRAGYPAFTAACAAR